jgi:hypothetical protein
MNKKERFSRYREVSAFNMLFSVCIHVSATETERENQPAAIQAGAQQVSNVYVEFRQLTRGFPSFLTICHKPAR